MKCMFSRAWTPKIPSNNNLDNTKQYKLNYLKESIVQDNQVGKIVNS